MSRKRKNTKYAKAVTQAAENLIKERFDHYLDDISNRINEARAVVARAGTGAGGGPVFAADLNIMGKHFLHGFTITNNSPAAGSVAWADLHVVYNGTDNLIVNGNTANKYLWWIPTAPTVMQSANAKPTLPEGGVLLFLNEAGTARNMVSDTNASLPRAVGSSAVDTDAIMAKAVTQAAIGDLAVGSGQLGGNAVISGKVADGAINTAAKLADNVVTGTKILDGAVTTAKLPDNAITGLKIAGGAVTDTKLADNAVTGVKIAGGAVTDTKLADNAVTGVKIAGGAVTGLKLADGAVTSLKLDDAAVTPTKMNILRHLIF